LGALTSNFEATDDVETAMLLNAVDELRVAVGCLSADLTGTLALVAWLGLMTFTNEVSFLSLDVGFSATIFRFLVLSSSGCVKV
jgi:hypothetical protein